MKKTCFIGLIFCCSIVHGFAQFEFLQMPDIKGAVQTFPTFNSCSYYFHASDNAAIRVEYKNANQTAWLSAHPTVCDSPEYIHKGSLFFLDEDAEYQIRIFSGSDGKLITQTTFRTWSSTPHIAKTIDLSTLPNTAQEGLVITEQGAPDAWIKYTAPPGWIIKRTIRDNDTQDGVLVMKGLQYIILENLTIEGGKRHGICIENCDFIRILNCDISGWGRKGVQQFVNGGSCGTYLDSEGRVIDYDGAIQIRKSYGTVVERCYIHDPRGRSNSWLFSHASGPQAIVADYTRGGNVIRWNDFIGSDEHRWNDVIECLDNYHPAGGLFRDSDIFGNYLAFGNDDGIELEGGGMNLRFVGNKIEGTIGGVSTGASMLGPQYVIGNLLVNLGDEEGHTLMFLKNSHGAKQIGKRLVYNNTCHGFGSSSSAYTQYGGATPVDAGLGTLRNNIFVCNSSHSFSEWTRAENYNHDLFWVNRSLPETEKYISVLHNYGQEKNALTVDPLLVDPVNGNFRLAPSSPARNKAAEVAGISRAGDDLGAFFNGATEIPLRPLAFVATPAQVNFQQTGGTAIVTLRLSPDAKAPVSFHIRQNNVFNWFTVTPASGTLSPGESLKLTVTTDPARLTGRPLFRGAFLVRTPNGLSRPITVYAQGNYTEDKRPASAPNTVYLIPVSGMVDKQVDIPKDGAYSLLIRFTPNRSVGQRFEAKINGVTSPITAQSGFWFLKDGVACVRYLSAFGQLKAGKNQVSIKSTNPNLEIAEFIITDNPAAFFLQDRYK